jgi:CRP/FNR family cyclic AMP-dependent transcriptional regulator
MEERFKGEAGQRLLVEALQAQKMVAGNLDLAKELADLAQPMHIKAGDTIILQDAYDNDIYFIIIGKFRVVINGRVTGHRGINDQVGEMAAIEPTQARSATIVADEDSVVCRLSEPQLAELAKRYPDIWRYLAKELSRRLAERNKLVRPVRDAIRVFIVSSAEALNIAEQIQNNLRYANFLVEIWTNGVFKASKV